MNTNYIKDVFKTQLNKLMERIETCFAGSKGIESASKYITALLSPIKRKNGWQMAEAGGDKTPYAIQQFLYRGRWGADELMGCCREYIKDELGCDNAVLVLDDTGFIKKGKMSAGVARQYSGTAGKIENCQIGVFLTYSSPKGFAAIDRLLYLPKEWTDDIKRLQKAGVPEHIGFETKPKMALDMLKKAYEADMPFSFITADSAYGDCRDISMWLESIGKNYVLAVSGKAYVWMGLKQHRVSAILKDLSSGRNQSDENQSDERWHRISCGVGSKGERLYDWFLIELNKPPYENHIRYLLVRRSISKPNELQAFICFCPSDTSLEELVSIAGTRWQIEQNFEELKGEVGLDHYEVRSYEGWHKHITLACLAHALLTVIKANIQSDANFHAALEISKSDSLDGFKKGRNL
jgi:SRSO17 transposase